MWQKRIPKRHKVQSSPVASTGSTTYTRLPHHVTVLVSQLRIDAPPVVPYEPFTEHMTAIEVTVEAASRRAARGAAYAITNSSRPITFAIANYLDVVRTYRYIGHFRSASVDDAFVVVGERFVCDRFGSEFRHRPCKARGEGLKLAAQCSSGAAPAGCGGVR